MSQKIALIISNGLNPFLVCFITVILMVTRATDSFANDVKWSSVSLIFSVIPVFAFVFIQVRRKKLESIFPEGESQRWVIYLLSSTIAVVGYVIMLRFDAPRLISVSFLAGLLTVIIFMLINFYWKISLHTAFISAAGVVLTVALGAGAAWIFILLPLMCWSRLVLHQHTLAQVITGAILSAGIISGVYWGFGII
jgi:membrane-associated phospholipid phosphatase